MNSDRDRLLSEFIDAWNAGQRPDVDDYLGRAEEEERGELADQLVSFLSFAPTPDYDDDALAAIRGEPAVAAALGAASERGGLLGALLASLRERVSMSTEEVAGELLRELGLPGDRQSKTASYLGRLERGELQPARVSRRVFQALGQLFGVPREELEGAGDMGGFAPAAAPVFRAEDEAGEAVAHHLEVLADALEVHGGADRDEVDDLFLGGR